MTCMKYIVCLIFYNESYKYMIWTLIEQTTLYLRVIGTLSHKFCTCLITKMRGNLPIAK